MSYHVVTDGEGLVRAVAYKQIWVEKKEDTDAGQIAYPVYGLSFDGSVYLLGVYQEAETANDLAIQYIEGKQPKGLNSTSVYVEKLTTMRV